MTFLVVDEFLRFNKVEEENLALGRTRLLHTFDILSQMYSVKNNVSLCSDFMHSKMYLELFEQLEEQARRDKELSDILLETVPSEKRKIPSALKYPLHELACAKHLSMRGYQLKIGPSKEKEYDRAMQHLGFEMGFAYILDAYALGTRTADSVAHYIPNSRGPNNGQRIFFEETEDKVKHKLEQGCDEALRYFYKIASVSGYLLGRESITAEEIEKLHGKRLKKAAIKLVIENIIQPYEEAE